MPRIYVRQPRIIESMQHRARTGQPFREIVFSELDLSGLNLYDSMLMRCKFIDCAMFEVNFSECGFDTCEFIQTTLEGSNFERSQHMGSKFFNVDLSRTNFKNAYFSRSSVAGEATVTHQMNLSGIQVKKNFTAPPGDLLDRFKELGKTH